MNIVSYRVVKAKYLDSAFDGEGARLYGGRWNNKGVPLVYTSNSLALCSLEIFIHLPSYKLLAEYIYITATFDSELLTEVSLIDGWDARPVSKIAQTIGGQWINECQSAVLKVPSVLMSDGYNYLINIKHPDFNDIKIEKPLPLKFDTRFEK
ncbi:MAG: RES family NAD+ phosphorylase [Deltaproteobacteria bacterium]|jgi:RES domain-containing protein|nr:RES family NAD+ phosphorylase [Deltaproteobacteria bacterium]